MHITCPHCQFSQDVPADRLPAASRGKSLLATCPRCACRFRLFLPEGTTQPLDPPAAPPEASAPANDGPRAGEQAPAPPAPSPENAPPSPRDSSAAPGMPPGKDAAGEEEEDPRLTASRAYEREAERGRRLCDAARQRKCDGENGGGALRNPWEEAPETFGYAEAFYQTVLRVMFGAPRFFLGIRDDAPPLRALLFFLVTGVLGVTALTLWGNAFQGMMADAADPQLRALAAMLPRENALLYGLIQLFLLVMQLYIVSALVFLSFRLSGCRAATYARVFQILAYSSAPMLLCAIPVLGYLAGFIWCLATVIIGCRSAFRLNWAQTAAGCLPIALLLLLLLHQTLDVMSKF